jgi:hypothetical protein
MRSIPNEPCLFIKWNLDGNRFIVIAVYVDDIFGTSNDEELYNDLFKFLEKKFKLNNLGEISQCLGALVARDPETGDVLVNNPGYVDNLLKKFNMESCRLSENPNPSQLYLSPTDCPNPEDLNEVLRDKYRMLIGSLMYMAVFWRPDICFMVNHLARYSHIPGEKHYQAALKILNYLRTTRDFGLVYRRNHLLNKDDVDPMLVTFTDSNYASDYDRVSTSGFVTQLIHRSSYPELLDEKSRLKQNVISNVVSYYSKRQREVSDSSTFAEYIACYHATKRLSAMKSTLEGLGLLKSATMPIFVDNEACLDIATNWKVNERSKHMDVRYHYIRCKVMSNEVSLHHVKSERNNADMLTKPLSGTTFVDSRDRLMKGSCDPSLVSRRKIRGDLELVKISRATVNETGLKQRSISCCRL